MRPPVHMEAFPQKLPPKRQAIIDARRTARRGGQTYFGIDMPFRALAWAGGNFCNTDWEGEDFSGCDLRGADFSNCSFKNANLRDASLADANLSDADLSEALNLLPGQLAGTDLTRARLEKSLAEFPALSQVKELSLNTAKVFLTLLAFIAFTILTMGSARDLDLFVADRVSGATLPLIGVQVPMLSFYKASALLLLGLFIYLHIYLQRLWELLAGMPAIFPDGRKLDETTYPWLLNDLCRDSVPRLKRDRPPLTHLQSFVSHVTAYLVTPLTLMLAWAFALHGQDTFVSLLQTFVILCAAWGAVWFWMLQRATFRARRTSQGRIGIPGHLLCLSLGLIIALPVGWLFYNLTLGVLETEEMPEPYVINGYWSKVLDPRTGKMERKDSAWHLLVPHPAEPGKHWRQDWAPHLLTVFRLSPIPELWSKDISTRPHSWTGSAGKAKEELALVNGANLKGKSLRHCWAWSTFLVNAELERADLSYGLFQYADFRGAHFIDVKGRKCSFREAVFSASEVTIAAKARDNLAKDLLFQDSVFTEADFTLAALDHIQLDHCGFAQADFSAAKCSSTWWTSCNLQEAIFSEVDLEGGQFELSGLVGAAFCEAKLDSCQFESSDLKEAYFYKCKLTDCHFTSSDLTGSDFTYSELAGATFTGSVLDRADFSTVKGLTAAQVAQAKSYIDAKLPPDVANQLKQATGKP